MKAWIIRPLRLFVDSAWLAGGALLCVLAAAVLRRLGAPADAVGWLLLLALVATLAISVHTAITKT